ncbi:dTDP-4-dehydrorhamnose reductase [Actinobacteria bacterium YIM 96077]|uniref:dTDP-4-dehydrorhamnose reductase n=1 Tax=Phytoactinopolyspora halophila TaxID=1981511 RepID=A0A329QHW0_9ACTN|nr:dTDP-4-dehydrorhamnose reductase [Phytoactinopolyspora halophila]AYY12425.1 dTDP-4-dehydrorhamnose reductase [Actinobacteria bacterium YIM 96077]RAW11997.1 dTDP-4-dehydrorhamnose reductase [Phytoactinopolyspora halophila]
MLSILVPGGTGQLGRAIAELAGPDLDVLAPGSAELNLLDADMLGRAVDDLAERARERGNHPLVINAAAYTAVDDAETDERRAYDLNVRAPQRLAARCRSSNVPLIHISTDYVFPGDKNGAYEPDDPREPRSVYGRTKAVGEDAVLDVSSRSWIVRTAWLYSAYGSNFVHTMIRLERERPRLTVVADQYGSPTWAADLAAGLLELGRAIATSRAPMQRVLHCTNAESTTWWGFARAIFSELGADPERVKPCSSADFPRPAPRPSNSVLSPRIWNAAGLTPMRPWHIALQNFFICNEDIYRYHDRKTRLT